MTMLFFWCPTNSRGIYKGFCPWNIAQSHLGSSEMNVVIKLGLYLVCMQGWAKIALSGRHNQRALADYMKTGTSIELSQDNSGFDYHIRRNTKQFLTRSSL